MIQGLNHHQGIHTPRTHYPNDLHVRRILNSCHSCEVSRSVRAPIAAKCDNSWFKMCIHYSSLRSFPNPSVNTPQISPELINAKPKNTRSPIKTYEIIKESSKVSPSSNPVRFLSVLICWCRARKRVCNFASATEIFPSLALCSGILCPAYKFGR